MSTTQVYGGTPDDRLPTERRPLAYETERRYDTAHIHRRVSWSALFAAVFVALAIELMLGILGVGVGLGFVSPEAGATPHASSLGIGAGAWWFASTLIAFGVGGFVAAWLAGITARFDGALHGVITWAISRPRSAGVAPRPAAGAAGGARRFGAGGASLGTAHLRSAHWAGTVKADMRGRAKSSY